MIFDDLKTHIDECAQGLRDGSLLAKLTAIHDETIIGSPERIEVDDALGKAVFAIQFLMDRIGALEGSVIPSERAFHALALSTRDNQGLVDIDTVDLSEEDYNAIWMRHIIKPEVCKNVVSGII